MSITGTTQTNTASTATSITFNDTFGDSNVTVSASKAGNTCTVGGTIIPSPITSNVTGVTVNCTPNPYTIAVSNPAAASVSITGTTQVNAPSTATSITFNDTYGNTNVTVSASKAGNTCTVGGTIIPSPITGNVTGVTVNCTPNPYTIAVSNPAAASVSITGTTQVNAPSTATSITFNDTYGNTNVTVSASKAGNTCTVGGTIIPSPITGNVTGVTVSCTPITYTLSGSNNSGATLSANGSTAATSNTITGTTNFILYARYGDPVVFTASKTGNTCSVSGSSVNPVASAVSDLTVTCNPIPYTVSGTVSGNSGIVTLTNNGVDQQTVSALNGSFTFSPQNYGTSWSVAATGPASQTCLVSNASGSNITANVTNVVVTCQDNTYTIGGTVTGLGTGLSVTLLNNGGNGITVNATGPLSFTFSPAQISSSAYNVTVGTQPSGQTCTVANGSGNVGTANIANVSVTCSNTSGTTYVVSGNITGQTGTVTLTNNGGDTQTVATSGTTFSFTAQNAGSNWNVAVSPPGGQVCYLTNASGVNISNNVTNVTVSCVTTTGTQTVGGTLTGLTNGAQLRLLNNNGDSLTLSANGNFTFGLGLAAEATYEVTIGTQPLGQTCFVFNPSGTMIDIAYVPTPASAINVTNIAVNCLNNPAYTGTILLGAPTDTSIKLKLFSSDQNGTVSASYGTTSGGPYTTTAASPLFAGTPTTINLNGLTPDTQYYYLVNFQPNSGSAAQTAEYKFHTARPTNSTYSFTIQADSHLDENTDPLLYQQTLQNIASDSPDFLIDLGDTFMSEKHNQALDTTPVSGSNTQTGSPPASTEQQVIARYRMDLKYFDIATRSVPLFLANGNHDAELGWIWNGNNLKNGLAINLATWASNARSTYYNNPDPVSQPFYSGQSSTKENITSTPTIPSRAPAAWYSWQWGDALFIVLDPYWNSSAASKWSMSLGQDQYNWLASTLASSTARFKFVFLHNLVGGVGSMRGGVEAAKLFEWGGYEATLTGSCTSASPCAFTLGSYLFGANRPNMAMPIHSLLVANKVTAVFHGHDHFYDQQTLDGIIYQEVPQPSARNTSNGQATATSYGYLSGIVDSSSGHLRITVSPTQVKSEYVRAWLPAGTSGSTNTANGTTKVNKQISKSWTCSYQSSTGLCQ